MKINKDETEIVGHQNFINFKIIADHNCTRIEWLTANYLVKITTDSSGWDVLYKDPNDNRYWELIYPNSEIHGGGPPSLIFLSNREASNKYAL